MGYRLAMSAEIHDWLTELWDSHPPAAGLVTRALAALADGGDRLGPPLVTALDGRYQAWLEGLPEPAGGLMELRPGAPGDDGVRIVFGVEPPGTALLIAVLEGDGAVRDHYREAILLASGVLRDARAGQDAEAAAHTFADAPSVLAEFLPAHLRPGRLHHVELWVPDLPRAVAEWGWLLTSLGYEPFQDWEAGRSWNLGGTYLVVEQSPAMTAPAHDRLRPGLNHLAFHAGSRGQVDKLAAQAAGHGWTLLFPDRHPHAGGPAHYAAYLANTDGYEVELVADDPGPPLTTMGS
jgi:catechol 2,3-dioxygenase-like lactoylglutathione lyase family enzyme